MMEVYVLVSRKKSPVIQFASIFLIVLGGFMILLSCYLLLLFALGVALVAIGVAMMLCFNKEFEYSYFDGEVRFAKVMNKNRRKSLMSMSMDEVVIIAPAGERSVSRYENDSNVKVIDYTSGLKNHPHYDMVASRGERYVLIQFEPDERYLDAVCLKYGQKVIRKKGQ